MIINIDSLDMNNRHRAYITLVRYNGLEISPGINGSCPLDNLENILAIAKL